MRRRRVVLAAWLVIAMTAACTDGGDDSSGRPGRPVAPPVAVALNQIQVVGTHNSYHREMAPPERVAFDQLVGVPGAYDASLAYSHAGIGDQLAGQGVRGLELDLFPDPNGGLYREPLVRRRLDMGPLPDPAWDRPGVKVLHIADLDYNTTCVRLVTCLQQVRSFSRSRPDHVPILILLELKQSDPDTVAQGGSVSPPWDGAQLDALDAEIRSVFGADGIITPDDVRRPGLTLAQSIRRHGWPDLAEAMGRVMFLLDNEGPLGDLYAAGRPNLEGRVIFTNTPPGQPRSAFVKRNDPLGPNQAQIRRLVDDGYLIRTRSDEPLATVLTGDTTRREAARASGAQLLSTDFPAVGMSARYDRSYAAGLPGGGAVRCNPVNGPPGCRTDQLE